MAAVKIAEGIYWVGAVDWTVRNFHGYATPTGTTYNAYLIVDDKMTLVDTVKAPFCEELLENIRQIVDPSKIDYVVSNHAETDHSGSLPAVMESVGGGAELVCVEKAKANLSKIYPKDAKNWKFRSVKEGDTLHLGKRTLQFIETPMLHWPESMFTYSESDGILFSMDAFGQHNATAERFDDELPLDIVMKEAAKYYANIIMPYSRIALGVLGKLNGMKINTLATSHGAIWRKNVSKIVEAYGKWARGEAERRGVVVYDSMWGSTEKMARSIVEGFEREGVSCDLIHLGKTDDSEAVLAVMQSKVVAVGSPTLNSTIFPSVARFLEYLKGLKAPGKKIGAVFGSYGWGGGASKYAKEALKSAGLEVAEESLDVRFSPTEDELKRCVEFGARLAGRIR